MNPTTDIGALRARYELAMALTDLAMRMEIPLDYALYYERRCAQEMITGVDSYRAERVEIVMLEEGLEGSDAHLRLGINFDARRRLDIDEPAFRSGYAPSPPRQQP